MIVGLKLGRPDVAPVVRPIFHQGAGKFRAVDANELSATMRCILTEIFEELTELEQRITTMNSEIEAIAARSDTARRLMTIPGVGPLAATALPAAAGTGRQFRKARDLAA